MRAFMAAFWDPLACLRHRLSQQVYRWNLDAPAETTHGKKAFFHHGKWLFFRVFSRGSTMIWLKCAAALLLMHLKPGFLPLLLYSAPWRQGSWKISLLQFLESFNFSGFHRRRTGGVFNRVICCEAVIEMTLLLLLGCLN